MEPSAEHPHGNRPTRGLITKLETQARNPERVSVYLDDAFAIGLHREVVIRHVLRLGMLVDEAMIVRLEQDEAVQQAFEGAVRLLTTRPRSKRELSQQLRRRNHDPGAIDAAIEVLGDRGYVDDEQFATFWVENRQANRPRGIRLIRQELRQKGVASDAVERALESADIDELQGATDLATSRLNRLRDLEPDVQRRRLFSFLERKGYGYDLAKRAVAAVLDGEADEDESSDVVLSDSD